MNYDDGIHFTENNIVQYLAELEEYISSLITYTAFKRDEPNAPISSIPLEKLHNKDFSKKQWNLEAPIDTQINADPAEDPTGDTGDIISAKELYSKFMQLHESKRLVPVYPNANKRQDNIKDDDDISV